MRNDGLIEEWCDRKIAPGQEWENEIDKNLESATVILLLISSDFLGSKYCYALEMQKAMELHESGKAVVVPIIIRSCDWARAPFAKLQALPTDAKPVRKWGDEDDAWLDVAKGLRKVIDSFSPTMLPKRVNGSNLDQVEVLQTFEDWLQDTEMLLTHRAVNRVLLSHIYVEPDLRSTDDQIEENFRTRPALSLARNPAHYLVFGEEQQGKTSLLKRLYHECYAAGFSPIYIDGETVTTSDIDKVLVKASKHQYGERINIESDKIVILIDDISKFRLNEKARGKLLRSIEARYVHVVITASKSFSYVAPDIVELDAYSQFDILKFGHEKRAEITEKWISLGVEEQISAEDLYRQSDELKSRLDSVIRGNIVPPKPIYVLMLLQMFEAYSRQNLELTSSGHCYQELIYQAFKKAGILPKDVGSYLNILTELAWALHMKRDSFSESDLEIFFDEYHKEYLKVDRQQAINKLQSNSILAVIDGRIKFKYSYVFYFFVAKKIAEGYAKNETIRNEISILLNELHREDYANILVFVTHHTKDDWILDEIQVSLMELFDDQDKADLKKDKLAFMDDFLAQIPTLVMEQRVITEERSKHHKRLDNIDDDSSENNGDHIDANDFLAKINKVFKGMEIAGQIVRNRHASLPKESLYSLVEQGSGTGLRFLNYFIGISDTMKNEVVRSIEAHFRDHPNITNEQVERMAETAFLQTTYGVINGVMRKIASAIGSKEASEIYDELEKTEDTPATMLLNRAISMHYQKELDVDEITKTAIHFSDNAVCSRILRELVIQHTYMFPVNYREKAQLAESLNISIQGQRLLDRQTKVKA